MTRHEAQNALAAYGPGIEDSWRHLHDTTERLEVRNAIPEILARIGDQKAADILCAELSRGSEGMEQNLIDSLYKIRSIHPKHSFQKENDRGRSCFYPSAKCYAVYLAGIESHLPVEPSASAPNWNSILDFKVKQIFDLLSLIYPVG